MRNQALLEKDVAHRVGASASLLSADDAAGVALSLALSTQTTDSAPLVAKLTAVDDCALRVTIAEHSTKRFAGRFADERRRALVSLAQAPALRCTGPEKEVLLPSVAPSKLRDVRRAANLVSFGVGSMKIKVNLTKFAIGTR